MRKLGLIAGGGSLPVEIAEHCERSGRPLFVIRLKGFAGAPRVMEIVDFIRADANRPLCLPRNDD